MSNNYFIYLGRKLQKDPFFSLLNLLGLMLGFASFILAYQFINRETSYDSWNPNLDHIYLVGLIHEGRFTDQTPPSLAPILKERIPEILEAGRVLPFPYGDFHLEGDHPATVKNAILLDSSAAVIFRVASQENGLNFLPSPQKEANLVTDKIANLLFDKDSASYSAPKLAYQLHIGLHLPIHGKIADQGKSYIQSDLLMIQRIWTEDEVGNPYTYQTFLQLSPTTDIDKLEDKITSIFQNEIAKHALVNSSSFAQGTIYLDPLKNLHLRPRHGSNSGYMGIWAVGLLSVTILVLAAANFANLTTVRLLGLQREMGIKLVMGASKMGLALQIFFEILFQSLLAGIGAWLILLGSGNILQKWFNEDVSTQLMSTTSLLQLLAGVVGTTVIAASYPVFNVFKLQPISALKGKPQVAIRYCSLRNFILGFQFVITLVFASGLFVIHRQVNFMRVNDKGFETDEVIHFEGLGWYLSNYSDEFSRFRMRLLQEEGITNVAATNHVPGNTVKLPKHRFRFDGRKVDWEHIGVTVGYVETLNMQLLAGSSFTEQHQLDTSSHMAIINEAALATLETDNPIGQMVKGCGVNFTIIGILKDSKIRGFEEQVTPTIYSMGVGCDQARYKTSIIVRTVPGETEWGIQTVKHVFNTFKNTERIPINYEFLDREYTALHAKHIRLQEAMDGFTLLTLLISALGLLGMTAYSLSMRRKELSIRKVLGANYLNLFTELNKTIFIVFAVSNIIAIPISYLLMSRWQDNFTYQAQWGMEIFLVTVMAVSGLLLILIVAQSFRAITENPTENLRDE